MSKLNVRIDDSQIHDEKITTVLIYSDSVKLLIEHYFKLIFSKARLLKNGSEHENAFDKFLSKTKYITLINILKSDLSETEEFIDYCIDEMRKVLRKNDVKNYKIFREYISVNGENLSINEKYIQGIKNILNKLSRDQLNEYIVEADILPNRNKKLENELELNFNEEFENITFKFSRLHDKPFAFLDLCRIDIENKK